MDLPDPDTGPPDPDPVPVEALPIAQPSCGIPVPACLASGLAWGCCEQYRPCTLVVYVHDKPIVRYYVNENGGRKLSVLPPHANQRSRVGVGAFDKDFQLFIAFIMDAVCIVHDTLDLVLAIDMDFAQPQEKRPVFECILQELANAQELGRDQNLRTVTVVFSNRPSVHTLLRK
jgi:hypothetical protein